MRTTWNLLLAFIIGLPGVSQAALTINEVAWMGSADSANHEWIELYNTNNNAIDVSAWTLKDGMNLNINLTGSIPGLSYVVLERNRSDGGSVVGTPFLNYAGALVNTGAALTLRDGSGGIIDQVAGGENWQNIGGDNATKETAQYTSSGWVTDLPTPGALNRTGRTESAPPPSGTSSVVAASSVTSNIASTKNSRKSVSLTIPNTILKITTNIQTVAYVNQTIPLRVTASGISPTMIDSLRYTWNFGDGTTATNSPSVTYSYAYPGTYVVTLQAAYARHEQVVRHEITVLPVTFSITKTPVGDIQVHNDALYDVDVSGYVLRGVTSFTFPPHSIILPRSTITIPRSRLSSDSQEIVALYDPARIMVASAWPAGQAARFVPVPIPVAPTLASTVAPVFRSSAAVPTRLAPVVATTFSPATANFQFAAQDATVPVANINSNADAALPTANTLYLDAEAVLTPAVESTATTTSPLSESRSSFPWSYVAFILLLVVAVGALVWPRRLAPAK